MMWSLKYYTEQIERMFRLMHQAALCYRYITVDTPPSHTLYAQFTTSCIVLTLYQEYTLNLVFVFE